MPREWVGLSREKERERECVTARNSGYYINTKSRPCVSHCPGVELSDCNTIALCYCKQDVLYCYCCPFGKEFSICDLQPSHREQGSQDLLIENKFALSNRDTEKHHCKPRFFFPHNLDKSRVLLERDTTKIYTGKNPKSFKEKKNHCPGSPLSYFPRC